MRENSAFELINQIFHESRITSAEYALLFNALDQIETLPERDMLLEDLWSRFGDVPMDPETEQIEEKFLYWDTGTPRVDIWKWFDERHSKGIGYLLYRDGIDRTDQFSKLVYLKQLCIDCESRDCAYNHDGICRYAMVHERQPKITEEDGCVDYCATGHDYISFSDDKAIQQLRDKGIESLAVKPAFESE